MKKIGILCVCMILLFAVSAFSASAAVSVTSNYGETSATFGGEDQKASNPELDDDDSDQQIYVIGTVGVANNGTSSVTIDDINVIYKLGFTASDFNITLNTGATINGSSTGQILINARISEKLNAVDSKQNAVGFNVAYIELKSGSTVVSSFNAYMQRENKLEIDNIKVVIGDDSQTIDNGDDVEDVKPGDKVEIIIRAENKFRDSDDIDIDADEGKWEIDGDVDEEDDLDYGELGPKEEDELIFDFTVDEDVDEGSYDFDIYVYGQDIYNAWHGERIEADFKVERERHEISVQNINIVPNAVNCGESFTVKVEVANLGKKNEDEVTIRIQNEDLEIDTMKTNIELDKGDTTTKTFDIMVPSDSPEGGIAFTVLAYYDFNEETDRETFTIDVSCSVDAADGTSDDTTQQDDTTTTTASTGGVANAESTDASTDTSASNPITTVRSGDGFKESSAYVILLVLAILIVVIVGAVLIAKAVMVK